MTDNEQMVRLSYKWPIRIFKYVFIFSGLLNGLVGFFIFILSFFYKLADDLFVLIIGVITFLLFGCYSTLYGLILARTKEVYFDNEIIIIGNGTNSEKYKINQVISLKRFILYFNKLKIINNQNETVQIFVYRSTNPQWKKNDNEKLLYEKIKTFANNTYTP